MQLTWEGLVGGLCCNDEETVIPLLCQTLKGCIGWEISLVGGLDVDL